MYSELDLYFKEQIDTDDHFKVMHDENWFVDSFIDESDISYAKEFDKEEMLNDPYYDDSEDAYLSDFSDEELEDMTDDDYLFDIV